MQTTLVPGWTENFSKGGRHGIRGSSCAPSLPMNLILMKQTKWMQSEDYLAITTEAGWCQVRKIFYLAVATYYVAAAT